jgi:plastocyanin domain-containing protein
MAPLASLVEGLKMNLAFINSIALLLIGLIIYWFWLSKPETHKTSEKKINITVDDGVYTPARIEIEADKPVTLNFLRKDASPCAEKVIFSDLNISEDLPINKEKAIEIKVPQPGEYEFTCQMQMYRGTLIAN